MFDRWGEDRDRRSVPRRATPGRISWKRANKNINFMGWLSDSSESGISFITSAMSAPLVGEEVSACGDAIGTRRYRVQRVEPYDSHFSLVGCAFIAVSEPQTTSRWPSRLDRCARRYAAGVPDFDQARTLVERRRHTRRRCDGPIWWRDPDEESFQRGWLIERSASGAAFLAKSHTPPERNASVTTATSRTGRSLGEFRQGVIRRVEHIHGDLYLVAAEIDAG